MTPKDKAIELYNKFYNTSSHPHHIESRKDNAKQYTLIAVDEILLIAPMMHMEGFGNLTIREYYKKVKQEIEKL